MQHEIDLVKLSEAVSEKRAGAGLRAVAKEIGISFSTLSRIEGRSIPDVDTYFRLCRWLGVSTEFFRVPTDQPSGPFVIVSVKWTLARKNMAGYVVFWGPNNCGYTSDIRNAGRYTQEEANTFREDKENVPVRLCNVDKHFSKQQAVHEYNSESRMQNLHQTFQTIS